MTQAERIRSMQDIFDQTEQAVASLFGALARFQELQPRLHQLEAYYTQGQWLQDYQDDENGRIAPDIPRGVLSQDGLYNLLAERDRLLDELRNL